jgi:ribosomal protein L10
MFLPLNALAGPSSKPLGSAPFLMISRSASSAAFRTHVKNSAPYRGKLSKRTRVFPDRKSALVADYLELLKASQLILFLRMQNNPVAELEPFRTAIKFLPSGTFKLTVLKANLLPPVLRSLPNLPSSALQPYLKGPLALLTASNLEPRALKAFLDLYTKTAARLNKPPPGATKGAVVKPLDRLQLLTGVVEQREFDEAGVRRVATLPGLPELHAQIVGMLAGPGAALAQVLQGANGQDLVATLGRYQQGLEEAASAKALG